MESRPVAPAPPQEPTPQAWPEPSPAASAPPPSADSGLTSTEDFVIERSTGPRLGSPAAATSPEAFGLENQGAESGFTSTLAPPEPQAAPSAPQPAPSAAPAATVDPKDEKARRLARALVSDILVYNRDVRDKALADGNLVQAMGQEIKKSWELYKEKVTPEVANSTNHFRDALNEILANGQQIF
jgi:hypothetical protein